MAEGFSLTLSLIAAVSASSLVKKSAGTLIICPLATSISVYTLYVVHLDNYLKGCTSTSCYMHPIKLEFSLKNHFQGYVYTRISFSSKLKRFIDFQIACS